MYAASWMLTRLNLETRSHHPVVDADQLSVLDRPSIEKYRELLIRTYGIEASVESALAATPGLDRVIDIHPRAKAGLIATDLLCLELRPHELAEVPLCPWLDTIETIHDAMGWLYVLERRTLLHGAMLRHLCVRLPHVIETASAYLRCYGNQTGARWRDLGVALDHAAATPETGDRIVAAADEAFWAVRDWFQRGHLGSRLTG